MSLPLLPIPCDVAVAGQLSAQSMILPASIVADANVSSVAAIQVTKTRHLLVIGSDTGVDLAGTFAAKSKIIFVASGAVTVRAFKAMLNAATTTGTAAFDLKLNGTTMLSGVVSFTSADSSGDVKTGTLASTALVAGDILSIETTLAAGTPDGTGPFAWVELDSAAY